MCDHTARIWWEAIVSIDRLLAPYNYQLPETQIARYPLEKRHSSRLLCLLPEQVDSHVERLSDHLNEGDLLVFNNTQVMSARCQMRRQTGGKVELLMCELLDEKNVKLLAKPSRKLREGEILETQITTGLQVQLMRRLSMFLMARQQEL